MTDDEAKAANVVEALSRVIRDLPAIGKEGVASQQQGGYKYRGIEQITAEAQPLFAKHGVVFVPRVQKWQDPRELTINGKPWTDERVLVAYRVYGPGGAQDFIDVGPIPAIGRDNSDKGANKCMSQAFKYALLQTLCISDPKDDADGTTHEADAYVEVPTTRRASLREQARPEDVARMKVSELADRLKGLGLDATGSKQVMADRLKEALEASSGTGDAPADPTPEQVEAAGIVCFAEGCDARAVEGSDYCADHNG